MAQLTLATNHRETTLVAQTLYFGLTTGAGKQTLGEEYCDILQVTGTCFVIAPWVSGSMTQRVPDAAVRLIQNMHRTFVSND